MTAKWPTLAVLALGALCLCSSLASAQEAPKLAANAPDSAPRATVAHANAAPSPAASQENARWRLEGEKRFATNCGRCHQAPHKYPPRMMATVVRHMRVRATITDDDMRYILRYITQ
jgi:mono/diheme cytochrome c family protein